MTPVGKILTSATIIPKALYVPRDADRQVSRLLVEMGRPGYVLVARQMGKTNLLINAKRQHETPSDLFVYCDLSNPLPTARECFQSIVDTALDTDSGRFATARTEIDLIRASGLPAHKEHETELRTILRTVPGRLVVILDEVDALTRADYSDQIFSQIRSVYFSRVNIGAFDRLTYLLSGVAEPASLIRNPKLSPFNIGEKIYLDDFSRDEYQTFLTHAGMNISPESAERIFHWTRGNPRMTWDVCAALEDAMLGGHDATSAEVDNVVARLYLESFDRAPVDHIRSLAEDDPHIRNALVELKYGNGSQISDAVRSKLYLSGIIGSGREQIAVKNPIIEAALSEQWLRDVEKRRHGLLRVAHDFLKRGDYARSIATLHDFLQEAHSADDALEAYDYLSRAHMLAGDYEASLSALQGHAFGRERFGDDVYFAQTKRRAACHLRLRQYARSVELFREVVGRKTIQRDFDCEINLGVALYRLDPDAHRDEIIAIYNSAISGLVSASDELSPEQKSHLLDVGRFNLAIALEHYGDRPAAVAQLEAALDGANPRDRPFLLWEMGMLSDEPERRTAMAIAGVDALISAGFAPQEANDTSFLGFVDPALTGLLALSFEVHRPSFDRLVEFASTTWQRPPSGAVLPYVESFLVAADRNPGVGNALISAFCDIAQKHEDREGLYLCRKLIATYDRGGGRGARVAEYVSALAALGAPRRLDALDVRLLSQETGRRLQGGDLEGVRRMLELIFAHREKTPGTDFVLFDYYSMIAAGVSGDHERERATADSILRMLTSDGFDDGSLLGRRDLETIRQAAQVAVDSRVRVPVIRHERVGRNEWVTVKYADEKTLHAKYKKVEEDLRTGRCVLLSRDGPIQKPSHGLESPLGRTKNSG